MARQTGGSEAPLLGDLDLSLSVVIEQARCAADVLLHLLQAFLESCLVCIRISVYHFQLGSILLNCRLVLEVGIAEVSGARVDETGVGLEGSEFAKLQTVHGLCLHRLHLLLQQLFVVDLPDRQSLRAGEAMGPSSMLHPVRGGLGRCLTRNTALALRV